MKVERTKQAQQTPNEPEFSDMRPGDAFISCGTGNVFIRLAGDGAVNVTSGDLRKFFGDTSVTPLPNAVLHTNE
jgi:hypothetical protein